MLQHYSPYKVAEQFRVLSALAPGRVALGVGKAPGDFSCQPMRCSGSLSSPPVCLKKSLRS